MPRPRIIKIVGIPTLEAAIQQILTEHGFHGEDAFIEWLNPYRIRVLFELSQPGHYWSIFVQISKEDFQKHPSRVELEDDLFDRFVEELKNQKERIERSGKKEGAL